MKTFKFELLQNVTIKITGEVGEVIGRAEYSHCDDKYFVRYKAADGRAAEKWWDEAALT